MKCKLALQVFSKRVSFALFTASVTGCIETTTVQHTATFFETLYDLFDNLNSRCARDPNLSKCALLRFYPNVEENLKVHLNDMEHWFVVSPKGLKAPSCFLGLWQSVSAILQLWDDLLEESITFLLTSRLNTDCLENFSVLRMHGGNCNQNPSVKAVRLAANKNILLQYKSYTYRPLTKYKIDYPFIGSIINFKLKYRSCRNARAQTMYRIDPQTRFNTRKEPSTVETAKRTIKSSDSLCF